MRKPGFCNVEEILEFLCFPLNSPHTAHKGSIESPLTPDTIHFFQAWITQHSTLRGQNTREWPTCTNMQSCSVMLHTHTHSGMLWVYQSPRAALQFLRNWDVAVPQQSLLLPGSDLGQILRALESGDHIMRRILTAPGWYFDKQVVVEKYLLDSALTLSISPSRVTSLSIKLETEKEERGEREERGGGLFFCTHSKDKRKIL